MNSTENSTSLFARTLTLWFILCHVSFAAADPFPATLPRNWERTSAGELHAQATAGVNPDLISVERYTDFEFTIDFKLPPRGSSGLRYLLLTDVGSYLAAARKLFLLMAGAALLGAAAAAAAFLTGRRGWGRALSLAGLLVTVLYSQRVLAAAIPAALVPLAPAGIVFIAAWAIPRMKFGEVYSRVPFLILGLLNLVAAVYAWREDRALHALLVAKPIALEFQLAAPGSADDSSALTACGALDDMLAAAQANCAPNQWHSARLTVSGTRVEHAIDQQQVLAYDLTSDEIRRAKQRLAPRYRPLPRLAPSLWLQFAAKQPSPVALAHHGGDAWFRNPVIRQLP